MKQLPQDFIKAIQQHKGNDFASSLENCILASESPVSIRFQKNISPSALDTQFEIESVVPWEKNANYLKQRPSFALDPLWHAGVYYVQEASSMMVGYLVKQLYQSFDSLKVLDLCAAPGGKSTQVLSILKGDSYLICNEILPKRAQILKENIIKSGYNNVSVTNNEVKDFACFQQSFDVVLIDAPCSGEGLFRKDENAMDEWSLTNVNTCVYRQKNILNQAMHLVKEDGYLFYSTCTYNQQENIEQVAYLLDSGLFESVSIELPDSFGFEQIQQNNAIAWQAYPNQVKGEGFFIAVLKKKGSALISAHTKDYYFNTKFKKIEANKYSLFSDFVDLNHQAVYINETQVFAWPSVHDEFIKKIYNNLKVLHTCKHIGELKKEIFLPSIDLAFQNDSQYNEYQFVIDVDKINALKFLRKENVDYVLIPEIDKSTWYMIRYLGVLLGWLKIIPNKKQNNHFPLEWRLRM
ncbi:MAG: methyltransferase domain-containing protein [Bacteroidota bacterium]